jgi:hypothetical protein
MHPASSLSLTNGQNIKFTPQGITITGDMTLPQWTEFLHAIRSVNSAYHCALADAINYGREHFGDDAVAVAVEQVEFDLADVAKASNIGTLPLSFRQKYHLSSEHYFVLSRIEDPAMQDTWAATAIKHGLTALELKRSIEAGSVVRAKQIGNVSGQGSGFNTIQGICFRLQQWEKSMGGVANIAKLTADELRQLADMLTPTLELVQAIADAIEEKEPAPEA